MRGVGCIKLPSHPQPKQQDKVKLNEEMHELKCWTNQHNLSNRFIEIPKMCQLLSSAEFVAKKVLHINPHSGHPTHISPPGSAGRTRYSLYD